MIAPHPDPIQVDFHLIWFSYIYSQSLILFAIGQSWAAYPSAMARILFHHKK